MNTQERKDLRARLVGLKFDRVSFTEAKDRTSPGSYEEVWQSDNDEIVLRWNHHYQVAKETTEVVALCSHEFCLIDDEGTNRCSKCGKIAPKEEE